MDVMVRYNDGPGMVSPTGVVVYFGGHLQETKEAGGMAACVGYLSRDGQVKPEVHNPDLWREVGWDPAKEESHEAFRQEQTVMGKVEDGRVVFADQADRALAHHRDALVEREHGLDLVDHFDELLVAAEDDVFFLKVGSDLHHHPGIDAGDGARNVIAALAPAILAATDRAVSAGNGRNWKSV